MNSPEITGMSYSFIQSIYYPLVDLYYTLVYVISYTNKIWNTISLKSCTNNAYIVEVKCHGEQRTWQHSYLNS